MGLPKASGGTAAPRGLALAFSTSLERSPKLEPPPAVDVAWFVAIGDTFQGPLNEAALSLLWRGEKIAADTLVWREGLADWAPVGTFAELSGLRQLQAPTSIELDRADPLPRALRGGSGGPTEGSAQSSQHPSIAEDFAATDERGDLELLGIKTCGRRFAGYGPWVAVCAATVFGVVVGYVAFSTDNSAEVEALAPPVATADSRVAVHLSSTGVPAVTKPAHVETASRVPHVGAGVLASRATNSAPAPETGAAAGESRGSVAVDSSGLAGLRGLSGAQGLAPRGTRAPSTGYEASGAPLDAAEIQNAVGRYKSSVKRGCWEPATSTRSPGSPATARVELTVEIAPSGRVSSVASSGDPRGFRGLARCIEGRVRGWHFPASGVATTTRIPFVFAVQ